VRASAKPTVWGHAQAQNAHMLLRDAGIESRPHSRSCRRSVHRRELHTQRAAVQHGTIKWHGERVASRPCWICPIWEGTRLQMRVGVAIGGRVSDMAFAFRRVQHVLISTPAGQGRGLLSLPSPAASWPTLVVHLVAKLRRCRAGGQASDDVTSRSEHVHAHDCCHHRG
jgi:hypothetical protein